MYMALMDEIEALDQETFAYLEQEVKVLRDIEEEYDEKSKAKTECGARLDAAELRVKTLLEDLDVEDYTRAMKMLKVKLDIQARAKVPKTPEEKEAFFGWLKEKGFYDTYITVNSNSINSLVKTEYELANDPEFSIPGLQIIKDVKLKY